MTGKNHTRFVSIPHPLHRGRLLCKWDPDRNVLEFQERGQKFDVDLEKHRHESGGVDRHAGFKTPQVENALIS